MFFQSSNYCAEYNNGADGNCPCPNENVAPFYGCCDEFCLTFGDCAASFNDGGWVSPNGITYADCYGNIGGFPTPP